ncbi:CPBP family intramembrane glutamic endopeptidase [Candidatus Pyrohabitans sp.]
MSLVPLAAGVVLFAANYLLLSLLFSAFPELLVHTFPAEPWWAGINPLLINLYVGIAAPVLEELVFRGFILGRLRRRLGSSNALLISSLAFGAYHLLFGWGWFKAVDMTLVGMVFGAVYLRYRLAGSIATHITNNLLSILATLALA